MASVDVQLPVLEIDRRPRRGRRHGDIFSMAPGLVLSQVVTLVAFCAWKPWNGWNGTDSSTALRAFKKPNGYYRRPLRPSRFDDGPNKEGEGRGEWQGDEGKFTVNWGDPRLQRQAFQEEEEEEAEDSSWQVEDSSWEVEEVPDFEEPPRQKRAPKRQRRMKTRSEVVNDKGDFFVKRREPWRPPVLRKGEEGRPRREAPRDARREAPRREAPDEAQAQFKVPPLDPPVRPINLERMAQQGLPIVNLYQLEPYDFYVYLIKELGIQRMHAKQIRQWLFTKGVQDVQGLILQLFILKFSCQLCKFATFVVNLVNCPACTGSCISISVSSNSEVSLCYS